MEAKDTVMGNDKITLQEIRTPTGENVAGIPVVCSEIIIDIDATLQAQAEISFGAGIREVVEWIETDRYEVNQGACSLGDIPVFLIHKESWQAKLEEWRKRSPEIKI